MKSYWEEVRKNYKEFEQLKENKNTTVCIIGGGLTGLMTAYYLCKSFKVILLEKNRICSSTSGKNTGKVTSQHGLFYNYLIESQGKEFAKKYLEANQKAIDEIERIVKEENIECDFKRENAYVYTAKETDNYKIEKEQKAVKKLNSDLSRYVTNIELPVQMTSAIEFKNQAKLHPVKLGYGLANCIESNNGKIYENSQVKNINRENDRYIVEVGDYKVAADYVIVATRYPIISFPGYYFLKMYQSTSYAIVFDCKTKLFNGVYIAEDIPNISFRIIDDDGKQLLLAVGYDYKTGTEEIKNGYKRIETVVKKMYPEAEILYKWTAEDCITLDKIPYIGQYSNVMKNLYIATGFNKWGITSSNVAAKILSDKILGKENENKEIFKSTRLEPIKNRQEVATMLKEANESILLSKFKIPKSELDDVEMGEGKIIKIDNIKVGVYKDTNGEIHKIRPVCTHLGCELYFNNIEKVWECPCHGSKFTIDGKSIEVPSNRDIE